jgi:hypothetical protein
MGIVNSIIYHPSSNIAPAASTLMGILNQRQHPDEWAVAAFNCPDKGIDFAEAIRNGSATAISDELFKHSTIGTSAFIL